MRPSEIQVGKVYTNGRYAKNRKVIAIEDGVVEFELAGIKQPLYTAHHSHRELLRKRGKLTVLIRTFADWAKAEVPTNESK